MNHNSCRVLLWPGLCAGAQVTPGNALDLSCVTHVLARDPAADSDKLKAVRQVRCGGGAVLERFVACGGVWVVGVGVERCGQTEGGAASQVRRRCFAAGGMRVVVWRALGTDRCWAARQVRCGWCGAGLRHVAWDWGGKVRASSERSGACANARPTQGGGGGGCARNRCVRSTGLVSHAAFASPARLVCSCAHRRREERPAAPRIHVVTLPWLERCLRDCHAWPEEPLPPPPVAAAAASERCLPAHGREGQPRSPQRAAALFPGFERLRLWLRSAALAEHRRPRCGPGAQDRLFFK